jgi:hypothetical protein
MRSNLYGQRNDGGLCQCADCDRTFGGLYGFNMHLSAEHPDGLIHGNTCNCSDWWPGCLTDTELEAKGLHLSAKGWWVRSDGRSVSRLSTETAAGAR